MKALALVLAAILAVALHSPAHAIRVAYYRVGAAAMSPGSLENPGTYGLGLGFNAGVSVPFMHRLAITLDLAHDRLGWEDGSEPTVTTVKLAREDLSVTSAMLGVDVAFRRGSEARPLVSAGLGVARVRPGDAEFTDMNTGVRTTQESEAETVFAFSVGAGVRVGLPLHFALRAQAGFMGLTREEFAYVVPLRVQVEF